MDISNPDHLENSIVRVDQLLNYQSALYPDKTALKYQTDTYSYKKLNDSSNRWALHLLALGVKKGDVIGVAVERSPEMIFTILAIIKAGGIYLPIDLNLPVNRISYMLDDCAARYLITSKNTLFSNQQGLKILHADDLWHHSAQYNPVNYKFNGDVNDIAYILYTSGSTGMPKGVQVKHSGLVNLLLSIKESPGANNTDVVLATTTVSFDIAALEIFLPLSCGATLILAGADIIKDGRLLIKIAETENVTIMQGTPIMWVNMLESGWVKPLDIKVFCGGEAMPKDLVKNILPKCNELWNMYGPTETTIYSIIKKITVDEVITVGKPIKNTQIYLCNENEEEVPAGQIGEIYIGGGGVALGYVNKPQLTAEKFIDDKFNGAGKLYKTGDLGRYLNNGDIECLGRVDHQIKIRGYRIETQEVEYQLKQLENVKDAIVVLYKDALNHQHLGAYIVLKSSTAIFKDQNWWKTSLKKILPEYMVPDLYKVIPDVPRLVNGKINRNALPAFIIGEGLSNEFEQPETETEISLSAICLNHIALERIGSNDNFFDLGVDSLTAVQIMVEIEQRFCKRLPLSMLLRYPTIRELGAYLDRDTADVSYKCLIPVKPNGNKAPLYVVHGIGLNLLNIRSMVSHLHSDQPVYGLQPAGIDGTMAPLSKMEDIANAYINEIIAHNPQGPYIIAGYSFGGYIAFEMARQLKMRGKEVAMLGMFDTNVQTFDYLYPVFERIKIKIFRQFRKASFRAQTILTHPILAFQYLKKYSGQRSGIFLKNIGVTKVHNPDNLPEFMLDIIDKLETAFKNYKLQPSDIQIDLFKAKIRMFYVDEGNYLGWEKYALKGVKIYNVPGDHKLMFHSPNDKVLAAVLQAKLDEINGYTINKT